MRPVCDGVVAMRRRNVANCGFAGIFADMSKRIAIVEDEAAIRENYAAAFRREGYSVDLYEARQPAMDAFDARLPDLVVIDVNLKDEVEGGFELCRDLRSKSRDLPIIFLTARDNEFDAVSGLRLGADEVSCDIAPGGDRFLVLEPSAGSAPRDKIHVTTNWFEELRELVPTEK